jgi:hypothetical protein
MILLMRKSLKTLIITLDYKVIPKIIADIDEFRLTMQKYFIRNAKVAAARLE